MANRTDESTYKWTDRHTQDQCFTVEAKNVASIITMRDCNSKFPIKIPAATATSSSASSSAQTKHHHTYHPLNNTCTTLSLTD